MKRVFNIYNITLILVVALISVLTLKTTEVKATGTITWPNGSTATISRTVENVYNAPVVEFTYGVSTTDISLLTSATVDTGENVNVKMKNLANNYSYMNYNSSDTKIRVFKRENSLPSGFVPTTGNTISTSTSQYPIYIWFDSPTGTIYYYTEAAVIYLNPDSSRMFQEMQSLANISGLSEVDTSNVTTMLDMFARNKMQNIDALSNWDTSSVTIMSEMFSNCSLRNIDGASNWDVSSVTNMYAMFAGCSNLVNINGASNWDTSSVTSMLDMFASCSNLEDINGASNWDTSSVTNMAHIFAGCSKASGTIQILGNPTTYTYAFSGTATQSGAQVTVNYGSGTTNIDNIIATKSAGSNVVKGSQVSVPSPGSNSSSGTIFNRKKISFDGSETVSNSYTVTKSTTIDFSNIGLDLSEPGVYDLTVKEIATSNRAYPTTSTEYTVTIQVQNVLDNNNVPTGNLSATFVIKDSNDNKVNSMSFSHPKDESKFGHIEVTKNVKGLMAQTNKYFDFTVRVDNTNWGSCSGYTGSEKYPVSGVDTGHFSAAEVTKCKSGTKDSLSLKHGQTAKIGQFTYNNVNYNSISIDDYYEIIEAIESDYTTTFKIGSGSETSGRDTSSQSVSTGTNSVNFYNDKSGSPLTGIITTIIPFLILIGIGTGGLILFRKKKIRKEELEVI